MIGLGEDFAGRWCAVPNKFVPANRGDLVGTQGAWLPPLSADDPELLAIMKDAPWLPKNHAEGP